MTKKQLDKLRRRARELQTECFKANDRLFNVQRKIAKEEQRGITTFAND